MYGIKYLLSSVLHKAAKTNLRQKCSLTICHNYNRATTIINTPKNKSVFHLYKFTYCQKKWFHCTSKTLIKYSDKSGTVDDEETRVTKQGYFKDKNRNKETFLITLDVFKEKEKLLRGHVEFIFAALKNLDEFGVQKDLEVYKKIMDVFPKLKMIPTNVFQVEFMHYPHHQDCALQVLCKMEDNGVIPDKEMGQILLNIFGKHSFPYKKYARMVYWMNKFVNASPWPLPKPIPNDGFILAKLAVERMCSVDQTSVISIFNTRDVKDSIDDTWIVSGQSCHQRDLLQKETTEGPLKVEGPFRIFLREQCVNYFMLRSNYIPPPKGDDIDIDDISNISKLIEEDGTLKPNTAITLKPSVHEQDDGIILAVCVTGTSSRDSLLSWIRLLSETNPRLDEGLAVVFLQSSPEEGKPDAMSLDGSKEEEKKSKFIGGNDGMTLEEFKQSLNEVNTNNDSNDKSR